MTRSLPERPIHVRGPKSVVHKDPLRERLRRHEFSAGTRALLRLIVAVTALVTLKIAGTEGPDLVEIARLLMTSG